MSSNAKRCDREVFQCRLPLPITHHIMFRHKDLLTSSMAHALSSAIPLPKGHTIAVDWWTLGIFTFELLSPAGMFTYPGIATNRSIRSMTVSAFSGGHPPFESSYPMQPRTKMVGCKQLSNTRKMDMNERRERRVAQTCSITAGQGHIRRSCEASTRRGFAERERLCQLQHGDCRHHKQLPLFLLQWLQVAFPPKCKGSAEAL